MIRSILLLTLLTTALTTRAQMPLSLTGQPLSFRHYYPTTDTTHHAKKWFLTKTIGISTAFTSLGGTFLSTPVGIQLNRQLTNNVYAFAALTVAPTFMQYNSPFYQNKLATYSAAHLGLMYVNDEKTFSISGSIGVSRNNYNPYYLPVSRHPKQ